MRIDGLTPALQQALIASLAAKADALRAKGEGMAEAEAAPPPAAPPPPHANALAQPATSVQMLVTLAAVDPVAERRRKALVQADRGLSMLESLRDELAVGVPSPERLRELANWSEGLAVPDDPQLAQLARDIELRVRVELAKHDLTA